MRRPFIYLLLMEGFILVAMTGKIDFSSSNHCDWLQVLLSSVSCGNARPTPRVGNAR